MGKVPVCDFNLGGMQRLHILGITARQLLTAPRQGQLFGEPVWETIQLAGHPLPQTGPAARHDFSDAAFILII